MGEWRVRGGGVGVGEIHTTSAVAETTLLVNKFFLTMGSQHVHCVPPTLCTNALLHHLQCFMELQVGRPYQCLPVLFQQCAAETLKFPLLLFP